MSDRTEPTGLGARVRDGHGRTWRRDIYGWWSGYLQPRVSWMGIPEPIDVLDDGADDGE